MTDTLSQRERQVLQGLWDGLSQAEVARQLGISPHTVRMYSQRARQRTGERTTIAVIRKAVQQGVLTV
jgi:RNA polymerase sigma factor (sigma-70 family)